MKEHKQLKGIFIILLAVAITLGVNAYMLAYDQQTASIEYVDKAPVAITDKIQQYTLIDVAEHNTSEDCWMAAYGNVYDITEYVAQRVHPGGQSALTSSCGEEVTGSFDRIHSVRARDELEEFFIGVLVSQ